MRCSELLLAAGLLTAGCTRPAEPPPTPTAPTEVPPSAAPPVEPAPEEPPEALTPRERDRRGDERLFAGRFDEAIADFDARIADEPEVEPYHWRRGIAYYYAGRYAEGAAQFEVHRTVNPADVENAAWHFLCIARSDGAEEARRRLLPVGRDPRPPMGEVYELFAGRSSPAKVLRLAEAAAPRSEDALFFAHLYLGLHAEATGRPDDALHHLREAATTHARPHYMGQVAAVHYRLLSDD